MNYSQSKNNEQRSLRDVIAAPDFASRLYAVLGRVHGAEDEAVMSDLLAELKGVLEVQKAIFCSYIRDDVSHESFRILTTAEDSTWCLNYRKDWYSTDPWLMYAMRNTRPASDVEIPLRSHSQMEARLLAAEHGVMSAYIVPAPASGGVSRIGVLVLGSSKPGWFANDHVTRVEPLLQGLAMGVHEWWFKLIRGEFLRSYRLTSNDLELLRCEQDGFSSKQIAEYLKVPESTINSRFQRLNAKLRQASRARSAKMAAEYGLI